MSDPLRRDGTEVFIESFDEKGKNTGKTYTFISVNRDKTTPERTLDDMVRLQLKAAPTSRCVLLEIVIMPEDQKYFNVMNTTPDPNVFGQLMLGVSSFSEVVAQEWCDKYRVKYPKMKFEVVNTHLLVTTDIPSLD